MPSDRVSFADGFPVLVTNAASLDDLNGRLPRPPADGPLQDQPLVVGGVGLGRGWVAARPGRRRALRRREGLCRCAVPTVDQESGLKDGGRGADATLGAFPRARPAGGSSSARTSFHAVPGRCASAIRSTSSRSPSQLSSGVPSCHSPTHPSGSSPDARPASAANWRRLLLDARRPGRGHGARRGQGRGPCRCVAGARLDAHARRREADQILRPPRPRQGNSGASTCWSTMPATAIWRRWRKATRPISGPCSKPTCSASRP